MSEEVLTRVKRCVAEVLALDAAKIQPASRLMQDLGAESLDLVELMYLLENEFEIRMTREDVSLAAQLGLSEEEIHQDEVLTPQALKLLRARFPDAQELLHEGITRRHLAALLTVSEVARSVENKLAVA
ncbi:MAG: acyl carrier protein [bacterium]